MSTTKEPMMLLTADEIVTMWTYVSGDEERFRKLFAFMKSLKFPDFEERLRQAQLADMDAPPERAR